MVQTVGNPYSNYNWGYTAPGGASAPVTGSSQPTYRTDSYTPTAYSASSMGATSYTALSSIINDPSAANRLGMFMINSPSRLLSVGAGWGSVGRFIVNVLSGNVPLVTSAQKQQEISSNVGRWISSADLIRTGASPFHATLLQDVGIWNVKDLAMIANPTDQGVLAQRLQMAASARGSGDFPNAMMVGSWVQSSIMLPKYNF